MLALNTLVPPEALCIVSRDTQMHVADIRTFLGKGAALDDGFARVELEGRRTDASLNRRTTSP